MKTLVLLNALVHIIKTRIIPAGNVIKVVQHVLVLGTLAAIHALGIIFQLLLEEVLNVLRYVHLGLGKITKIDHATVIKSSIYLNRIFNFRLSFVMQILLWIYKYTMPYVCKKESQVITFNLPYILSRNIFFKRI